MNQERRNKIVEMLGRQQTVTNAELMEKFGISIETVRRDLAYLEGKGLLERVYGGAVRKAFLNTELEYISREKVSSNEKTAIATEAEKLIDSNDTVFFDLGTTVQEIARKIDKNKKITAITNSLRTATALSENNCEIIMTGGHLRNGELALSGSIAENNMSLFNLDKAVIGVAGITEDGITDFVFNEASLRAQAIKNAGKVIAVADHTKFGIKAMCRVCDISQIDVLITDDKSPKDVLKKIKKSGVQVIVVK